MIFRQLAALCAVLSLAGCGVIYTAPSIGAGAPQGDPSGPDLPVEVVPLTYAAAAEANAVPYEPRRLPAAFQGGRMPGAGGAMPAPPRLAALPQPSAPDLERPGFIEERFPPLGEPRPYRIGVSDIVVLSVGNGADSVEALPGLINAQAKRKGYVVQDDGAIAIPDAGRVRIGGMTLQEAEAEIFQALVNAGLDPSFSLEIAEFNSQRVSVGGAVSQPGLVPIGLKPLYLHEAIQIAGGLDVADPSVAKVQLIRGGKVYRIGLERFLDDPAARQVILRDGDSVFVGSSYSGDAAALRFQQQLALRNQQIRTGEFRLRLAEIAARRGETAVARFEALRQLFRDRIEIGAVQRDYAYVTGEVTRTSRFTLPFEARANMADALFNQHGPTPRFSDYGEIYLLRQPQDPAAGDPIIAYHLDAENAANLAVATQLELRPNDVIFVAEQPVTSWNRVLSQILPSIFISSANVATGL